MGDNEHRILNVLQGVERAMAPDHPPLTTHGIVRVETPDGAVAVIGPVLDRLVATGHVVRRPDGTHQGPSNAEVHKWVAELAVCDFCAAPHANHILQVPDFDMATGRSVGGWAACDTCHALYKAEKGPGSDARVALLQRAIDSLTDGGKWSAAAVQALHKQFWQARDDLADAAGAGAALADFIEDRLPDVRPNAALSDRDKRAEAVRRLLGLTGEEQAALSRGDLTYGDTTRKLVEWKKKFGKDYEGARMVQELLRAEYRKPVPPNSLPHWERALEARFNALKQLDEILRLGRAGTVAFPEATDLNDKEAIKALVKRADTTRTIQEMQFPEDARLLRAAETYSFNAETIGAIREAARSIPHDAPLSSIETPNTGAGWFWFAEPIPVASARAASPNTAALLWGWVKLRGSDTAAIRFSTYVVNEAEVVNPAHHNVTLAAGNVLTATRWRWPIGMSFHDMIVYNRNEYRQAYGPGGSFEGAHTSGEADTLAVIAELSLFFVAACVWFKQKIVLSATGHVERHARKRYQREHKLADPPRVQIVALREAVREPGPAHEMAGEHGTRNYTCRWIVKGHPRLQAVGPGRTERKLIWIDPHPAGPADKPLRTRERVYAVVR